jgi:hypothetical protein
MTDTKSKKYNVGVIERALAYYDVEAEDARTAAENWQDGEFSDRDDEVLDPEGPCSIREQQPDGSWRKLPRSEWEPGPAVSRDSPCVDVHGLLAERRHIAEVWSVEDVRQIKPCLADAHAWEVLQSVRRFYDPAVGITWGVLGRHADALIGGAFTTDEEET